MNKKNKQHLEIVLGNLKTIETLLKNNTGTKPFLDDSKKRLIKIIS